MNSYSFTKSIVEGADIPIDPFAPLTFLDWYTEQRFTSSDINVLFQEYKKYVVNWSKAKAQTKIVTNNLVRDAYIQVLRDVAINYSTKEEQKFISNADFTNKTDLDIVLPFFIRKIKNVCLFYARERERAKYGIEEYKTKGSTQNVKNAVSKIIFDSAYLSTLETASNSLNFPPLSAIIDSVSVNIEELYDVSNQYYNVSPQNPQTTLLYNNLSAANINEVDNPLYLDFKQAIVDAIKEYPFFIKSLGVNNFTINPVLSGTEVQYLKPRDFIEYLSGGNEDLKINVARLLAPKYLGNDFYYLSTGSTATDFVSGMLFSTKPLTGANTLNLLNRQYPSTATVPSLQNLYSEYELGKFFLPQHSGILIYNAPDKYIKLDTASLQPNKIYAFPDPDVIGNTSYNSGIENESAPFIYEVDVSWNKISRSNQFAFGDVLSNSYNQLFYGYQSLNQDLNKDTYGLSRSIDNVQFWTGEKQDTWANPDIWPGLKTEETYPIDQRQQSILSNDLILTHWGSDKFGNDYGIYKNTIPLDEISVTPDGGLDIDSFSISIDVPNTIEKSIFQKKSKTPGYFFFRDSSTSIVQPASAALSAVFVKYPALVRSELSNSVLYFAMYQDTFVIETTNYIIIDSILFDYESGQVFSDIVPGTYFIKDNTSSGKLEAFAGEWFYESDNTLFLVFLKILPSLSASNFRAVYPLIYKTPLTNVRLAQVYPKQDTNIYNIYSLSGISDTNIPPQINLFKIDGISFSRDLRKNIHNLTYLGKNLNDMPFIVNEQLVKEGSSFKSLYPVMFEPFYFIHDNNYYNPSLQYIVRYNASTSGVAGDHEPSAGTFNTGQQDSNLVTYLFNDGITPLQVDKIGSYVVQFDWESYARTSFFVGCQRYSIFNVNGIVICNNGTSNFIFNELNKTHLIQTIPLTASNTTVYSLSVIATRLTYPDPGLLRFDLITAPLGYGEGICEDPDSIYHVLDVAKMGVGTGTVFTDPYCINCGTDITSPNNVCKEIIYDGSTITLIASADYYSTFIAWGGVPCLSSEACTFSITNYTAVTAFFGKARIYDLAVASIGYYNNYANYLPVGNIWCNDPGIFCGTRCSSPFRESTLLTLSCQVPLSGWYFKGFVGGQCEGFTEDACTFFISQDQSVSATYVRVFNYNLCTTVSSVCAAVGSQYGRVVSIPSEIICAERQTTCTSIFSGTGYLNDVSDLVTISAQPMSGYCVSRWEGNWEGQSRYIEVPKSEFMPCGETDEFSYRTFNMTEDTAVSAFFDIGYYTLTVIPSGTGFGWVTVDKVPVSAFYCTNYDGGLSDLNVCCYQFLSGTTITVALSNLQGSSIRGVYSDDCLGDSVSSCTFKMDKDKRVVARFDSGNFVDLFVLNSSRYGQITSSPAGIGCLSGTGDCLASYKAGQRVSLSASTTRTQPFLTFFGTGIIFSYIIDPSVIVTYEGAPTTFLRLSSFSPFTLTDGSIVITDPLSGAPYVSGGNGGIRIGLNTEVVVPMTTDRAVSAIYL